MNEKYWKEQICCGETSKLQFKREKINGNSLAAEFVAFVNSKGGTVLFGVEDKTGIIWGLSYQEVQDISEFVGNVATQLCNPTIYLQTETIKLDEKIILAVYLEEGTDKPYKDNNGIIWVKQGADKRKVTENSEILRLFSQSKTYSPDETAVNGTSLSDLDEKKVDHYLNKVYGKGRDAFDMPFENLMSNMRIATSNGELTLAGLLYFGKHPQQYRPAYCIKAVAFYGNDIAGTEYRDSRDFMGTIPELFDQAMHFLDLNLHHIQAGQSFNSLGILEISKVALEEICQNALCHREYIRQAPIRLLIFDNRIEIISPGALPDGLTVEEIKMGRTAQRNPLICTLCARTMNYRGLGSGILRAMKEVEDIEFVNNEVANEFTIIINRPSAVSDKSETISDKSAINDHFLQIARRLVSDKLEQSPLINGKHVGPDAISKIIEIVNIIASGNEMKTSEIATQLSMSNSSVRAYIQKLRELELIRANGSNKNRTYSVGDLLQKESKL